MRLSQYEIAREANIARNRAELMALGLDQPIKFFEEPKEVRRPKKPAASKKRKATSEESDDTGVVKIARTESEVDAPSSGTRRSARNTGKTVDYKSEQLRGLPAPLAKGKGLSGNEGPLRTGSSTGKILKYGTIPGIEVGTWWQSREDCSNDSIHAPWVAGISGTRKTGAYSIALSGGYDDDIDLGYGFTYTGAGGRDLKGTKAKPKNLRTAPQSCDQSFEHNNNAALKKSLDTGKPVRVIRGYKCRSEYAPSEGYRYDGLYTVEKAWMEKGLNDGGYLVCKFAFKRLPNQPLIPKRDPDAKTEDEQDEGNESDRDADGEVEIPGEDIKDEAKQDGMPIKSKAEIESSG